MRYWGNNRISVNNHTISYNDEGPDETPVIILIHGFPFNKSMWNKQVELLLENYRVITYDIRGHGDSEAGTEDFSIGLFADDLLGLMDYLKIEKAMLCGLSLGGYIALNAIEKFPKRFDALVLCDTTCAADTPETKEKRRIAIENITKYGIEQYASESIKKLFAPETFITSKEKTLAIKEMIMKTSEQSLTSTLLALAARTETCSKLAQIRMPVLIMVGKEDKITPPSAARFMQKTIKGSTLQVIEHAAHLSNIENPYEFNQNLLKFVSSFNHRPDNFRNGDRLGFELRNSDKTSKYEEMKKDLNAKILKMTMTIKNKYPELSKYLDEMPDTIPDEKDTEITLKNLSTYYGSLNSILKKYKSTHPAR
ncbi:MAG: alpha/beta fold hydrolase [Prolixibacteraceae bacterium]|jgi:3-oxoadipate enol-lactonase